MISLLISPMWYTLEGRCAPIYQMYKIIYNIIHTVYNNNNILCVNGTEMQKKQCNIIFYSLSSRFRHICFEVAFTNDRKKTKSLFSFRQLRNFIFIYVPYRQRLYRVATISYYKNNEDNTDNVYRQLILIPTTFIT